MERRQFVVACLASAMTIVAGCASVGDAKSEKGSGSTVVYSASFDDIWKEIPRILSELQLKPVSDNPGSGEILAETGLSWLSWGERIAVFVSRADGGKTRVEVVSKRAVGINVTATDWAPKIHDALRRRFRSV